MQRGREQTKQRLIDAVAQLITEKGIEHIGINRIASQANVNKILIYRYFGGLAGLLDAYYRQHSPVVQASAINLEQLKDAPLPAVFDACYAYMLEEFRLLRQNVQAQEYLRADLLGDERMANPIAAEKEKQILQMLDKLSGLLQVENPRPFAAIVIGAMSLLTLMSQQKKQFMGVDLGTDEGWQQIEQSLGRIFRGAYLYTEERLEQSGEKLT